jgi:hypothetical protein
MDEVRVLAVDPFYRGFGYAVLEGPERLIDWGVAQAVGDKNIESLQRVAGLIRRYEPELIVVEDYVGDCSRRCQRVCELIRRIRRLAAGRKIKMRAYSRGRVREAFAPDCTKHRIANAIAVRFPELAPHVPPFRKCWMSEDYRMTIFDALAFALTFFHFSQSEQE